MPTMDSEFDGETSISVYHERIEIGETWELTYYYYGLPRRIWIPAGTIIPPVTSTSEAEYVGTINLPENPTDEDYEAAFTQINLTWTFTAIWGTTNNQTSPWRIQIPINLDANDVMLGGQKTLTIMAYTPPGVPLKYLTTMNLVTLTEDLILYEP